MKEALNACERLGHFEEYKQAYLTREKASRNARKQEDTIKTLKQEGATELFLESEREKKQQWPKHRPEPSVQVCTDLNLQLCTDLNLQVCTDLNLQVCRPEPSGVHRPDLNIQVCTDQT